MQIYGQLDEFFNQMWQAESIDVYSKWEIGRVLKSNYPEGMTDLDAQKIAGHYHRRDHKELYRWVTFFTMYPTRSSIEQAVNQKLNGKLTWRGVRAALLPKDTRNPDVVGGKDNQVEEIMGFHEVSTARVQDYIQAGVDDKNRDEVVASLTKCIEVSFEALRSIDNQAQITVDRSTDYVDDVDNSEEHVDFPILDEYTEKEIKMIRAYVRHSGCAVTGYREDTGVELAHFPVSKGAGAPDHMVIGLCTEEHRKQHQHGIKTYLSDFETLRAILTTVMQQRNSLVVMYMGGAKG